MNEPDMPTSRSDAPPQAAAITPHDEARAVRTRQLWLTAGILLLAGWMALGFLTPMAWGAVLAIAEWARAELVERRDWPLDEEWTTWRPPADWTTPPLPDSPLVAEARRTTLP